MEAALPILETFTLPRPYAIRMGLGIIIISMLFLLAMVATVLGAVAIGRGRRWEGEVGRPDPASLGEIGKLREEMDRLSAEVHRLQEEQSFIVNLLGEVERKRLLEGPPKDG